MLPEEAWPGHRSKEELANNFAEFFECKILTIREKFEGIPQYETEPDTSIPQLAKYAPMTENQVKLIIKNMKSKHCKLNCIPMHILKEMMPAVLPTIMKIVNLSLSKGIFSEQWKTAIVKPLLKKLGLDLINSNYQPVSNLSFLSKLVEKCMWLQLSNHCQDCGLLPDYQSAYRPNYSCETNLFECQHITSLTAMDLSAAFDTVDHEVLLQILSNKFGVMDTTLNWFRSYLQPRQFKVKVRQAYSSERSLTYSVPQGSCAGANILNLYCSPRGDTIPASLSLSGFADDHSIRTQFHANNRIEEIRCKDHIEKAIITTKNWMDSMRLKMNLAKTEIIYFGHHLQLRKCSEEKINVAGDEIKRSTCIKYLGAYLDEGLMFKRHVAAKCKAAMGNLLKIRSIRHLLDKSTMINLCLSLCISHLDYANSLIWTPPSNNT